MNSNKEASEALQVAKHYFDLSNRAELAEIESLFHPSATYSSANYGLYFGPAAIMEMMRPFFAEYRRRQWTVVTAKAWSENIAEIRFSFRGESLKGEQIERTGLERIVVHSQKIQHVEVRPIP